jgi:hypothetical protein
MVHGRVGKDGGAFLEKMTEKDVSGQLSVVSKGLFVGADVSFIRVEFRKFDSR